MRNADPRAARTVGVALCVAWLGCQPANQAKAPPLLAPTHYLDEPFALGAAQCQLVSAAPMLTEAIGKEQELVAEDLSVVELSFACEDARGMPVPFASLPTRLTWVDRTRSSHTPTTSTRLSQQQPDHVVFEVPSGQDGLLRNRSYDANTGQPLARHEPGSARLYLEPLDAHGHARTRVVVAPWPRLHDEALDALLDRLARTLASDAPAAAGSATGEPKSDALSETETSSIALASLRPLYRRARDRFASKVLSLHTIAIVEGQPRLTLSLESSARVDDVSSLPHPSARSNPFSASFQLELAPGSNGRPSVMRLLDPEGTRSAIECALQSADLRARVELAQNEAARRARENSVPEAHCNALGVLVPHACALSEANLLQAALRVQTRCGPSRALGLDLHEASSAPSDFEVKLRRGQTNDDLDGEPRYSLTLSRSGQVHFEGLLFSSLARPKARFDAALARNSARFDSSLARGSANFDVSLPGPSEGRTSQALLAALWGHLLRLGWFEREPESEKRCADGERGDVISVLANGRTRLVRDRDGCRAGFSSDELTALRRVIERVGAIEGWTTPSLPVFSRDAEIWVVAAE